MRLKFLLLSTVFIIFSCNKKGFDNHVVNIRDSKVVSEMIVRGDVEIVINYYEDGDIANIGITDKEHYSAVNYPLDYDVQYHFEKKSNSDLFENFPSIK